MPTGWRSDGRSPRLRRCELAMSAKLLLPTSAEFLHLQAQRRQDALLRKQRAQVHRCGDQNTFARRILERGTDVGRVERASRVQGKAIMQR